MTALVEIIVCLLYSAACLCFGAALLRVIAPQSKNMGLAASSSAFLLGSGVLACVVWQLLATFGVFSPGLVVAVLVAVSIIGVRFALPMLKVSILNIGAGVRWFWHLSLAWKVIVLLILALIIRSVAYSFLPPQALGDAAAFYLVLPKIIVQTGTIQPIPAFENFVAYTLQGELHYAALMAISTVAVAKMFTVPVAMAAVALLVVLARKVGMGWPGQLIAVAALCTSTAFNQYVGYGKTDTFAIAMCLAAVYWATEIDGDQPIAALRLTGLFGSLTVSAKLTDLVFMPLIIFLLMVIPYVRKLAAPTSFAQVLLPLLRSFGVVLIFAALLLIPHLIKNTVIFHNPAAPFASAASTDQAARQIVGQVAKDEQVVRRVILGFPFFMVYAHSGNTDQVSVLALAFIPLIFALPRSFWTVDNKLCLLLVAALFGFAVWQMLEPTQFFPRYFLVTLVPPILLVSFAADYILTNSRFEPRLGALIIASTMVVLAITHTDVFLGLSANFVQQAVDYKSGRLTECDFENDTSDRSCHVAQLLNTQADPGSRLFLSSYTSTRYWLRPDLILCSNGRADLYMLTPQAHAEKWNTVYSRGYQYVLVNDASDSFRMGRPLDGDGLPKGLKADLVYQDGSFSVYHLSSSDPALQPGRTCQQSRPGIWSVMPVQLQS